MGRSLFYPALFASYLLTIFDRDKLLKNYLVCLRIELSHGNDLGELLSQNKDPGIRQISFDRVVWAHGWLRTEHETHSEVWLK